MKACTIYRKGATLYLTPEHTTVAGFSYAADPKTTVGAAESPRALGEGILAALAESREGVPVPQNIRQVTQDLLAFVGARTWKGFENSATCLGAYLDGHVVVLTPTKKENGQGYSPLPERAVRLDIGDPERIGQTAIDLLTVR